MSSIPNGRLLWFELLCRDAAKTADFYTNVCDWTVIPWDMGNGVMYNMLAALGVPIGAVFPFPADAPAEHRAKPHWMPYLSTPDTDASVAQLLGLGGKVWVPARTVPTVGRMAVVADRTGAEFAFFTPENAPGDAPSAAPVGHVGWIECAVSDAGVAFADYGALFGWTSAETFPMGPMGTYHVIHGEGRGIGGFFRSADGSLPPWRWLCYVRVADLDAAYAKALALGASSVMAPNAVPGGNARIAMLRDPEGAAFALQWVA